MIQKGHPPGGLLFVVGLVREARIVAPLGQVCIGRPDVERLAFDRPLGLVSFGLCGALDSALSAGDLIVADTVRQGEDVWPCDPAWSERVRRALPEARRGDMAGGDVILATAAAKARLHAAAGAAAVDMESHHVARAAAASGLPFVVVRAISDAAERSLPEAAIAGFRPDGQPDIAAVIGALLRRPFDLPALLGVARDAEKAFRTLHFAARALTSPP